MEQYNSLQPPIRETANAGDAAANRLPRRWMINSPWRVVSGLALAPFCGAIAWAALHHENFSEWPIGAVALIAAACTVLPLGFAMQGGITLDRKGQSIIRWWGPGFALRSVRIPYRDVRHLIAEMDAKPSHQIENTYRITLATDQMIYDIRSGLHDAEKAQVFAQALADELECPWRDHLRIADKQSPIPAEPSAGLGVWLLVVGAVGLCWIPVVGLVLTISACFAVRRVEFPVWANAMLLLGFFVSAATSIVGSLVLLDVFAGSR